MTTQRILPPPEIIFGLGAFNHIENFNQFHQYGKHFLICIGKKSARKNGYLANLILMIKSIGAQYTLLEGLTSSTQHNEINVLAHNYRKKYFDAIITLGGSSVINCAKALAVLCHPHNTSTNIWDYVSKHPREKINASFPIIAIPTAPGYGAKLTPCGLVKNNVDKKMGILHHHSLIPKLVLIDSNFLATLPNNILFTTIVNIFISYSNRYITGSCTDKLTDNLSEVIIKNLVCNSLKLKHNRKNTTAKDSIFKTEILEPSYLLNTFVDDFSLHQVISRTLTNLYDISHRKAVAISFLPYLNHIQKSHSDRLEQFFRKIFRIDEIYQHNGIQKGINNIIAWLRHLDVLALNLEIAKTGHGKKFCDTALNLCNNKKFFSEQIDISKTELQNIHHDIVINMKNTFKT